MLLVTGGAGFIGSNVVASLNEAGRTDIAVNDWLGSGRQVAQPAEAPARRLGAARRPAPLARGPQARRRDPSRRDLGHDRDRWRCSSWTTISASRCSCSTGARRPARRSSTPRRPRPTATAQQGFSDDWSLAALKRLQADESLRLEQAPVRSRGGRARRARTEAAAAMGRAEILQRVRPERVSQGRDDEPCRQAFRRGQGGQAGPPVQVASRRHRATASRGAISSMSTTPSRWCAGCWKRRQ